MSFVAFEDHSTCIKPSGGWPSRGHGQVTKTISELFSRNCHRAFNGSPRGPAIIATDLSTSSTGLARKLLNICARVEGCDPPTLTELHLQYPSVSVCSRNPARKAICYGVCHVLSHHGARGGHCGRINFHLVIAAPVASLFGVVSGVSGVVHVVASCISKCMNCRSSLC